MRGGTAPAEGVAMNMRKKRVVSRGVTIKQKRGSHWERQKREARPGKALPLGTKKAARTICRGWEKTGVMRNERPAPRMGDGKRFRRGLRDKNRTQREREGYDRGMVFSFNNPKCAKKRA